MQLAVTLVEMPELVGQPSNLTGRVGRLVNGVPSRGAEPVEFCDVAVPAAGDHPVDVTVDGYLAVDYLAQGFLGRTLGCGRGFQIGLGDRDDVRLRQGRVFTRTTHLARVTGRE